MPEQQNKPQELWQRIKQLEKVLYQPQKQGQLEESRRLIGQVVGGFFEIYGDKIKEV